MVATRQGETEDMKPRLCPRRRWTVPLGLGIGRLVRHGEQPVDYRLAAYSNLEGPAFGPDWTLQLTVKLLFPK